MGHWPGPGGVGLLTADEGPLVEPAPEVLRGFELVVQVGDQPCPEARVAEDLRQGVLVLGNRPPSGRGAEVALEVDVAVVEGEGTLPGVEGAASAEGGQRLGVGAGEP